MFLNKEKAILIINIMNFPSNYTKLSILISRVICIIIFRDMKVTFENVLLTSHNPEVGSSLPTQICSLEHHPSKFLVAQKSSGRTLKSAIFRLTCWYLKLKYIYIFFCDYAQRFILVQVINCLFFIRI